MFLGMDKFNADNLLPINYWFCKLVALKVAASESYSDKPYNKKLKNGIQ